MTRDIEKDRARLEQTLKFAKWCSKLLLLVFWSVLVAGILVMLVVLIGLFLKHGLDPLDQPWLYLMVLLGSSHAVIWYGLIRFFRRSFRQRIARFEAELDAIGAKPAVHAST